MESLSAALDTLYGATMDYSVRKKGERQCIGFAADFIDDAFTPHDERLLEPVSALLGELLLDPLTRTGDVFWRSYVDSEKANLIDAIRSLQNDKRDWADIRLMQEMCAGEPYSILRLETRRRRRIEQPVPVCHMQSLMAASRVEVIYCGSAEAQRVEDAVLSALAALPRGPDGAPARRGAAAATGKRPGMVTEVMDVNQGKLALGYRCTTEDVPAMILANLIFGGTSNSKLFLNVREKLSLCYYASSSYARSKNIMTVSSGVEQKTMTAPWRRSPGQLQAVQKGEWEDWEQEGALQAMLAPCCHPCRIPRARWRTSIWVRSPQAPARRRRSWPRRCGR